MTGFDKASRYGTDLDMTLAGKVVMVTGGVGGIAMATNEALIGRGARVAILYPALDAAKVPRAPGDLGTGHAAAFPCDVTDEAQVESAVRAAIDHFGDMHMLVNAAGCLTLASAETAKANDWRTQIDVNLTGAFLCAQQLARHCIGAGHAGKIVSIASQAALRVLDNHCAYAAAKSGLISITRSLAKEWARHRINVNAVSPTFVWTQMATVVASVDGVEKMTRTIPLGRLAYADEIAAAIVFLLSNCSDMITGENLVIDGGFTL